MEKIKIIIGEEIPENIQCEFSEIEFYLREEDNINLYAIVNLPYLINHAEAWLDIEGDPRYVFYEGYEDEFESSRFLCQVKPLGELKGVYRLGLGSPFKIRDVVPLSNMKVRSLNRKNLSYVKL